MTKKIVKQKNCSTKKKFFPFSRTIPKNEVHQRRGEDILGTKRVRLYEGV